MGEEQPISTANINARVITQEKLQSYISSDPDTLLIVKDVETPRDVVVITNRINGNHGPVHSATTLDEDDGIIMFKY